MPGFIVHVGAQVKCTHGGLAQATTPVARVLVSTQPVVTMLPPFGITGCPFNVSGSPVPCVTGFWSSAATRVFAFGQPVVIASSTSTCLPNGTPMIIGMTQTRVTAM